MNKTLADKLSMLALTIEHWENVIDQGEPTPERALRWQTGFEADIQPMLEDIGKHFTKLTKPVKQPVKRTRAKVKKSTVVKLAKTGKKVTRAKVKKSSTKTLRKTIRARK